MGSVRLTDVMLIKNGWHINFGECVCIGNHLWPMSKRMKIKLDDGSFIRAPDDAKIGERYKYTTHRHGGEHLEKL